MNLLHSTSRVHAEPAESRFKTPTGAEMSSLDAASWNRRVNLQNRLQKWQEWWVIDPRTSKLIGYWDGVTVAALFFVALVTPFEVAFLDSPTSGQDIITRFSTVGWLFCMNRIVDALFCCDLVMQFRLMYCETSSTQGTRWVSEPFAIVRHYLLGWFIIDFMSIAVAVFDIIPIAENQNDVSSDDAKNGASSPLRLVRVMRVLRLIKLVRLLRASRLFSRWETKIAINYSRLNLARSVFNVCYISHFFACIWGLLVSLSDTKTSTWAGEFNYCTPVSSYSNTSSVATSSVFASSDCVPDGPWQLYSVSVYWAVMTITSIGYGDMHATPHNITEQVVNTLLMLSGAIIWGNLIGTFCGVVATMNPHTAEFNRRMDDLNRYVKMHGLHNDLRRRLREYLHQTRHLQTAAASKDLLTLLSPALQGEVTWAVNKQWLMRVSFFQKAEPEFLVQISLSLTPLVFTPGELAINGFLYIVHRGIALYGGRVLTSGKVWGEDCIITSVHLQRRWCARAMNYLEVYMISREDVLEVAMAFPRTYQMIRKTALRMAVRRQFILAAKLIAAQSGESFGSSTSRTFDRLLEQATSVSMSEFRLQSTLTTNRLEAGPNQALIKHGTSDVVVPFGSEEDVGTETPTASAADRRSARRSKELTGASSPPPTDAAASASDGTVSSSGQDAVSSSGQDAFSSAARRLMPTSASAKGAKKVGLQRAQGQCQSPAPAADGVSSQVDLVSAFLRNKHGTSGDSVGQSAVSSEALDALREELGGKVDAMGSKVDEMDAKLAALQSSMAAILDRLPLAAPAPSS